MPNALRLGTRGSALARWQTNHVGAELLLAWPGMALSIDVMRTQGDKILDTPLPLLGGKGLFTAELEAALMSGAIDLAVHSLKDLPIDDNPALVIGAILPRAPVNDVFVSRSGAHLAELPPGASIGTSSRRRAAQLLARFPHLRTIDIRGNVDTRIRKAQDPEGPYDGTMLAMAGMDRLGWTNAITEVLPLDWMLPAPGQGALAVQCRNDAGLLQRLAPLDDGASRAAVTAERAFLLGLGGGCSAPVAAYGWIEQGTLHLRGRVSAVDGSRQIDVTLSGSPTDAQRMGLRLAQDALAQGADAILRECAA
ncbi:MAG: hydroxymethylbilane synthase [Anaerolineales bacterium]|nr:hydroxymethylbilane synthase [Anaerolineales bacterium]